MTTFTESFGIQYSLFATSWNPRLLPNPLEDISHAIQQKKWVNLRNLLESVPRAATDSTGKTALMYAAVYLQLSEDSAEDEAFIMRLLAKDTNTQALCKNRMKAVHYAAIRENHGNVLLLLKHSSDFAADSREVKDIYDRMYVAPSLAATSNVKKVMNYIKREEQ